MPDSIYLDHNATARPAPEAVRALADCLRHAWGNPSSSHPLGQTARRTLDAARRALAAWLGCKPAEIVFTSGATEANTIALRGAVARACGARRRLLVSRVEHAGLLKLVRELQAQGTPLDFIDVRRDGALDLAAAQAQMRDDVALVSVMAANNETGVLMPIAALARMAHACGALLHVDATQLVGRLPFDFAASGADLASLSAHKIGGPKGVGALLLRHGLAWPALFAGTQERGRRGGTENLPGIAGFAAAAGRLMTGEPLPARAARIGRLRDRLEQGLRERLAIEVYGATQPRLPNTSCLRIAGLHADEVLNRLERLGVIASAGAACMAGADEPSHVLLAMGVAREEALGAVRFSLGDDTTEDEIRYVVERLPAALGARRAA